MGVCFPDLFRRLRGVDNCLQVSPCIRQRVEQCLLIENGWLWCGSNVLLEDPLWPRFALVLHYFNVSACVSIRTGWWKLPAFRVRD